MNIIIRKVLVTVITCVCVMCMLNACGKEFVNSEKYNSYICYDYHLKCLEAEGEKAEIEFSYQDDLTGVECTQRAWIQRIDGESDDMFIYAEVLPSLPLGSSEKIVMQNPNHYVDVWKDWSIEKIELYYIDGHKPVDQDKPANIPTAVIATTVKDHCLSNIKNLAETTNEGGHRNIPEGYVREHIDENGSGYRYYIRVHFKESENIVWESPVESYYSSENKDRIMYIDVGKEPDGIAYVNTKYVSINNYPSLFGWINEAMDTTDQVE